MLSILPASQSSWHFVIPKKIYEIQMKNMWNLQSVSSRIFAFCTEIPTMMIKGMWCWILSHYIYLMILRNGRGSFVGPSSSRLSLLTSRQLKVLWMCLVSVTNQLLPQLVLWAWLLPQYASYNVPEGLFWLLIGGEGSNSHCYQDINYCNGPC